MRNLLIIIFIFASTPSTDASNLLSCTVLVVQNAEIKPGTICSTTKKRKFMRVKNVSGFWGWQDLSDDGLVWYDLTKNNISYKAAKAFCEEEMKQQLPSTYQIEMAGKHGIGEIFFGDLDKELISSELVAHPGDLSVWRGHYNSGKTGTSSIDFANSFYRVRCVGEVNEAIAPSPEETPDEKSGSSLEEGSSLPSTSEKDRYD